MASKTWVVPSVERYKAAFEMFEDELCDSDLKMLKIHYECPAHTLSATDMAEAMGYANYGAANLRYEKLGGRLCEQLNVSMKYKVNALCSFVKPNTQDNEYWLWVMHPQVVQALEELGWVAATKTA